jgi:hypothetical protein
MEHFFSKHKIFLLFLPHQCFNPEDQGAWMLCPKGISQLAKQKEMGN